MLELFIPRKIGSRQILPEKRLAIHIAKPWIYASMILVDRTGIFLTKNLSEPIVAENDGHPLNATVSALQKILNNAGHYDTLISSIDSAYCICKSIYFPFASEEKARLVIEHELEPALPYKLSDAICDAYITHVDTQNGSSQVIGVATQRQFIEQHLEPFKQLEVAPDIITTDVCALYTLSSYLPKLAQSATPIVLVYVDSHTTTLLMIQNGQYRASRSLNKGLAHIARLLQKSPAESMKLLERAAAGDTIPEPVHKALLSFWQDLAFTITSFLKSSTNKMTDVRLVLSGAGNSLAGLCRVITEHSSLQCSLLSLSQTIPAIAFDTSNAPSLTHAVSIGAALPPQIATSFNLLKKEFSPTQKNAIIRTLLISAGLITATLLGATIITWFRADSLSQQVESGAREGIELLQESFTSKEIRGLDKNIPNATTSLPSLVKKAKTVVDNQENLWQKFTQSAQSSFLYHLYILFNEIDQKAFGLTIERLSMDSGGIVSLKARVRDLNALELFNHHIPKSPYFTLLSPPPQNESFDIKIQVHNGQG